MAANSVTIVYQKILLFPFSRQWGCQNFHGRMNMALPIVLTFQTIGLPQFGHAFQVGCKTVPHEQTFAEELTPPVCPTSTAF